MEEQNQQGNRSLAATAAGPNLITGEGRVFDYYLFSLATVAHSAATLGEILKQRFADEFRQFGKIPAAIVAGDRGR